MAILKGLDMMKFKENIPNREAKIAAAQAVDAPPIGSYTPNRLAAQLHPAVQHLRVEKVVQETADAISYTLVPDTEKGTKELAFFSAGNYLSIREVVDGVTLTRPYSLSSSPKESEAGVYRLTVKRTEGGLMSVYIQDHWRVGTCVEASAPLGTFTYNRLRDAKTIVGLAGGSGITPFYSMAQAIAEGDMDAKLILLYGAKTVEDIVFHKELDALAAACEKLQVVYVLSDEEREGFAHGFLSADLIRQYAPEDAEYSIFICGPKNMYRFVDQEIATLGLRRKFVRHELFGEPFGKDLGEDAAVQAGQTFQLTVHQPGEAVRTITCSTDETLLRSMEKAGIHAPAHCRSGVCGFCHSRLMAGKVYVPENHEARREADMIYSYVHPCVSFPLSDLEIELPIFRN